MSKRAPQELSKLQLICTLFASTIGDDLYLARQIKESIEASLPPDERAAPEAFVRRAEQLSARSDSTLAIGLVATGLSNGFSMLTLRARLLAALKATCRFERSLLVLTGLRESICPADKRWTARRKREYEEAIDFARAFCRRRSRPSSQLALVIL